MITQSERFRKVVRALIVLAAVGSAGWLVDPTFRPRVSTLDLSRTAALASVVSGGVGVPSQRWREVMDLSDDGTPLVLTVPLVSQESYYWRFKVGCRAVGQRVRVMLNGAPLVEHPAVKGGGAAERFTAVTQASAVRVGANQVQFAHDGPAGSVRYEAVLAQNYRSKVVANAAYLVWASWPRRGMPWGAWGVWLVVGGWGVWQLLLRGSRWLRWLYRMSGARETWWWLPCPVAVTPLVVAGVVPWVTPYRLVLSPLASGVFLVGLIAAQWAVFSVPGVLWRLALGVWSCLVPATMTVGSAGARGLTHIQQARGLVITSGREIFTLTGFLVSRGAVAGWRAVAWVATKGLPQAARVTWREVKRRQNPEGYVQFFFGLLAVSGLLWLFRAKPAADRVSEWAWCALLIACLGYAMRALRTDDDPE